ncbi:hypothetical protein GCM10023184_03970 [Flaviaesturariibacter amylovorans]|uniref:N-acetyltransferase domain-containing protein n=1 Tax=Flaviaesturariibacter amylovorans TaxID=1084520 RepID=A0ABP8G806_9BACT
MRQLLHSDDKEIFALRSDAIVNKYLDRKPCKSIDDARDFIGVIGNSIEKKESIYWAITLTGADKLIGTICLYGFSGDCSTAEIGFELLPHYHGNGIMQEAVATVIEFGLASIGLKSIEAYTHCENLGSLRILEKFNFKQNRNDGDNLLVYKLRAIS